MRLLYLCLFLVPILLAGKPAIAATEMEEREAIINKAREAFEKERFAELDEMARRYRVTRARTPSGIWHLTCFYAGIQRAIDMGPDSGERKTTMWKVEDKTFRWRQKYPNSTTMRIVHSMIMISKAWAWRGPGPGGKISEENIKQFGNYLSWAYGDLELTKKESSVDPQWHRNMLILARGFNWKRAEFDGILADAMKKEPLFYETYFQAFEYLLPKWHGSIDDIEALASRAADATANTEGQALYARIYWWAWESEFRDKLFTDTIVDWSRMKAGFDDMVAKYPDKWNLSAYARFACLAGDRATTRSLLDRIGPEAMASLWRPGRTRERCADWARSETKDDVLAD